MREVTVRSELGHVSELESGLILVVPADRDSHRGPRLQTDVVEVPQDVSVKQQVDVRFD